MVNPEETETVKKETLEQERGLTRFQEKFRRGLFWCLEYWRELFNFRFDKYMIIQMLPGVYGMLLVALVLTIMFWCGVAFMNNVWVGLGATFFAAPIAFLVFASLLRALLEFYLVIFKMAEHVDELVGLRDTVDRLSGISDTVDEMVSMTRRIPFWKAISGKPAASSRRKVPEGRRRRNSARTDTQDKDADGKT